MELESILFSDTKNSKIRTATNFISLLPKSDILFAGISGSVSYEPEPGDDVDIFLITKPGKLWKTMAIAFILRRKGDFDDICLSLCLDAIYAEHMFSMDRGVLIADDAVHVIPLYGENYYLKLIAASRMSLMYFPGLFSPLTVLPHYERMRSLMNYLFFLIIGPVQMIKAMMWNHDKEARNEPEQRYTLFEGPDHFYFDSARYQRLRLEREGSIEQ